MKKEDFKKYILEKISKLKEGQKIVFKLNQNGYEIFIHKLTEEDIFIYVPSSYIWESVKLDLETLEEDEIWELVLTFINKFQGHTCEPFDEENIIVIE